jgi:mannose-1-phosphate guanylyltransferase
MAVDRLQGLFSLDHVLIVTSESQAKEFMIQIPKLKKDNFLFEPEPKGTAAVICLAAQILKNQNKDSVMAVLTADHIIKSKLAFHKCLVGAYHASLNEKLVTLGIKPACPHTGYGYIQVGELFGIFDAVKAFKVKKFKEKPNSTLAQKYFISEDHLWNSGMFIWKASTILNTFQKLMPDHYHQIDVIANNWKSVGHSDLIKKQWKELKPETIDFGIMEHAKDVVVIEGNDLGWSDLGSWESFFEILDLDKNGNSIFADLVHLKKSRNTLVYQSESKKLIVTLGLDDMIIVETKDTILVCRRENLQEIRDLVSELAKLDRYNRYL